MIVQNIRHSLKIDRPIVLVGLMGVGKSTIGRKLAGVLGIDFVDADIEIEVAAGLTISEIFEKYGEDIFRDGERRVIRRLIDGRIKVVATGGGAFMNEATRALILERATAVWIDADVNILAERVSRRDTRPLLKGKDATSVLRALAEVRNPIYQLAHIHVRSEVVPSDVTVDAILEKLS
ncbi:MAG: shikimate kinase [Pseudomonadota bacterium]